MPASALPNRSGGQNRNTVEGNRGPSLVPGDPIQPLYELHGVRRFLFVRMLRVRRLGEKGIFFVKT